MHRLKTLTCGVSAFSILVLVSACSDAGSDADTLPAPMPVAVAVEPPAPVPTCDTPPSNGAVLSRDNSKGVGGHKIGIVNGGTGNTIVNVRDSASNDLVLSFFVGIGETASVGDIPDGSYKVQYANGFDLGEDCKQFVRIRGASEDPEVLEFPAGSKMELTYELLPRENGNFTGATIDASAFASE